MPKLRRGKFPKEKITRPELIKRLGVFRLSVLGIKQELGLEKAFLIMDYLKKIEEAIGDRPSESNGGL